MSPYDWPPAFAAVQRQFAGTGQWAVSPETIGESLAAVSPGQAPPIQSSFSEVVEGLEPLTWLMLSEVDADVGRAAMASKLVSGISRLHGQFATGVVVNLGSNGEGDAGIAIGLPGEGRSIDVWTSGLATEMIFTPGGPYGWSALAPRSAQCAELGLPAVALRQTGGDQEARPTVAELLLQACGSLRPWSVDMLFRPLPMQTCLLLRTEVTRTLFRAGESVNRTSSRSESESVSFVDSAAERLIEVLEQWGTLADDCLRLGGWTASIRIRATDQHDVAAISSIFSVALGDEAHVSHPARRQRWLNAAVRPGGEESSTWLSSREVADLLSFSGESSGNVQRRQTLASGRQLQPATRPIDLGTWLGSGIPARVDLDDFVAHGFVAGITGSGKSTTTRQLLAQAWNRHQTPFLIIDPAKTDYSNFGRHLRHGLRVVHGSQIRMNVLRAWPGCDPAQHITRVSNAFRGSFSMPSPVPYVASILFEELAQEARHAEVTLHDGWARLDSLVDELQYRGEIEDNIRASFGLRLRLLLQPTRADRVACLGAIPDWLMNRPTVVQLSDVADDEERNFLASVLLLYLGDAARQRGLTDWTSHITVVEEAHRIMPARSARPVDEGDSASVSTALVTQLLAEVRAYGEALLIIDQSPSSVAGEVLRNTNVKLVHRTVDPDDQAALGGAIGLDMSTGGMLGSLSVGRALISSRHLVRPQTAEVSDRLPEFDGADFGDPEQRSAYECHLPQHAARHHVAERYGAEMELVVASWALGLEEQPHLRAAAAAQRHAGAQASCLLHVGLRRYVRTVRTVGYPHGFDTFATLWNALVTQQRPPEPGPSSQRPFLACRLCPDPCVARALVSPGTLRSYRRAERDLRATRTAQQAMARMEAITDDVAAELGDHPKSRVVAACVRAHLAEEAGVASRLVEEYSQ